MLPREEAGRMLFEQITPFLTISNRNNGEPQLVYGEAASVTLGGYSSDGGSSRSKPFMYGRSAGGIRIEPSSAW